MDNKLTRTIIALEQEGLETKVLALNFVVPSKEFNLRAAVSEICEALFESYRTVPG